jgi:hypothetical protein
MFPFRRKNKDPEPVDPGPGDDEPVDPEARSPGLGIKNKDLLVLAQLMAQGAELSKPRHALYYLYFTSKDAAEAGASEASSAGYACDVRDPLPQNPDQWSLVCERPDAILDPNGVNAADDLFQGIADRLGGDFDGWEAAARP